MQMNEGAVQRLQHVGGGESKRTREHEILGELHRIRNGPDSLSVRVGKDVLDLHKALADCRPKDDTGLGQGRYYWEITKNPDGARGSYFEFSFGKNRRATCASLFNLPMDLVAICIDNVVRTYLDHLYRLPQKAVQLYGDDTAKATAWRTDMEIQLLQDLLGGFRHDHLLSVKLQTIDGNEHVLGSLGVAHGNQRRKIIDTIGCDGIHKSPPSSLATNFALNYRLFENVRSLISDVEECEVSELTRLCSFARNVNPRTGCASSFDFSGMVSSLYAAVPPAVQQSYEAKFFVFFSERTLHDSLLQMGYPVIVAGYDASPTAGILRTPHSIYLSENRDKFIPQIMEFNAAADMSDKLMKMLVEGKPTGSR